MLPGALCATSLQKKEFAIICHHCFQETSSHLESQNAFNILVKVLLSSKDVFRMEPTYQVVTSLPLCLSVFVSLFISVSVSLSLVFRSYMQWLGLIPGLALRHHCWWYLGIHMGSQIELRSAICTQVHYLLCYLSASLSSLFISTFDPMIANHVYVSIFRLSEEKLKQSKNIYLNFSTLCKCHDAKDPWLFDNRQTLL